MPRTFFSKTFLKKFHHLLDKAFETCYINSTQQNTHNCGDYNVHIL